MSIKNQVQLIGHVGNTPEIKEVNTDKKLARFSVATNESYKNAQGEWVTNTEWHQVVAWNGAAQRVEKTLQKGTELALQGKLTTRSWEDTEGKTRYTTEIVLNEFTLVGVKAKV